MQACVALILSAPAKAHEPLGAEEAETILTRVVELRAQAAEGGAAAERAEALYALGEAIERVRVELNRDLVAHGGDLGLATSVLARELESRGIALVHSPPIKRYKAYLAPYRSYLALLPEGPWAANASFRILSGRFYDSFAGNPFRLIDLDWPGLEAQIARAESLMEGDPEQSDREETLFILGVDCVRAARAAPDPDSAQRYAARARAVLTAFQAAYPESLRAITARTLLKKLPKES